MIQTESKIDRIWRVKWAIWQKGLTIKKVCEDAGLNPNSVYAGMNGMEISDRRLSVIEKTINKTQKTENEL